MQVKIFNTATEVDPVELNRFLAEDGKTISVKRIHTACSNGGMGSSHFVTVEYYPEKQEEQQLQPVATLFSGFEEDAESDLEVPAFMRRLQY